MKPEIPLDPNGAAAAQRRIMLAEGSAKLVDGKFTVVKLPKPKQKRRRTVKMKPPCVSPRSLAPLGDGSGD